LLGRIKKKGHKSSEQTSAKQGDKAGECPSWPSALTGRYGFASFN